MIGIYDEMNQCKDFCVDTKEQRIKKLAGIKSMYDIDLKGRITPEEQKLFDDCINLKISVSEFYEQLNDVIAKKTSERAFL